jgi:hypothetical protein
MWCSLTPLRIFLTYTTGCFLPLTRMSRLLNDGGLCGFHYNIERLTWIRLALLKRAPTHSPSMCCLWLTYYSGRTGLFYLSISPQEEANRYKLRDREAGWDDGATLTPGGMVVAGWWMHRVPIVRRAGEKGTRAPICYIRGVRILSRLSQTLCKP